MKISILIILYLISISFSYFTFPFNKDKVEITSKDNLTDTITKLQEYKPFITINIGSEKANIKTYITQSKNELFIGGKNVPNHKYDESTSSSYNCTNSEIKYINYAAYKEGYLSTETFNIKNGKNEIQEINNVTFILGTEPTYQSLIMEGQIGLHLPYRESFPEYNFIKSLKKANATESYNWYFDFDNFANGGGQLVIDGYPHDVNNKKYNETKYAKTNCLKNDYYTTWGLEFSSIYYDQAEFEISYYLEAHFEFDYGIISAPYEDNKMLDQLFFNKYIKNNICFKDYFGYSKDIFFYCKSSEFNVKEFKSIYLKSQDLEIIFELDYEDLFYKKDDYLIFLVVFKKDSKLWRLGTLFLQKYYIVFNNDDETVGYYQGMEKIRVEENKGENKSFKYIIIIILLVLILVGIIVLIVVIFMKKIKPRKNRANELDDVNFTYEQKNEESDDKKDQLLFGNIN